MAITSTNPNDVEQAYGYNMIKLANSVASPNRHVLQIYDDSDTLIGDLRQLPNSNVITHYNINRLLQSQVSMTPTHGNLDLFTCPNECFNYYFKVGTITTADVVVIDATYSGSNTDINRLMALPGKKGINDDGSTDWGAYEEYVPEITVGYNGTNYYITTDTYAKAVTDRHYDETTWGAITDGKPAAGDGDFVAGTPIYKIRIAEDQDYSLQFINRWLDASGQYYNGINYIRLQTYTDNTLVSDVFIDNTTVNGGGPDTTISDEIIPKNEYAMIGANIGFQHSDITSAITHYYVWASSQATDAYITDDDVRTSQVYRFDITDGECNDYDNPIAVRWLNSVGGVDYFDFRKKNEVKSTVNRNTYQSTNGGWADVNFRVYPYERGETIYNQSINEIHTADTRYLTDDESTYLRNLYESPDVQVKFFGETVWKPVVLTSNSWTGKTFRKDKLFQHSITFRLANKPIAQGG